MSKKRKQTSAEFKAQVALAAVRGEQTVVVTMRLVRSWARHAASLIP